MSPQPLLQPSSSLTLPSCSSVHPGGLPPHQSHEDNTLLTWLPSSSMVCACKLCPHSQPHSYLYDGHTGIHTLANTYTTTPTYTLRHLHIQSYMYLHTTQDLGTHTQTLKTVKAQVRIYSGCPTSKSNTQNFQKSVLCLFLLLKK